MLLKEIKALVANVEYKTLISNFSYLFAINIANYILPLVTIPYIVRVIGISNFGLLSFVLSIITYFTIFVDYGFNLFATREVAIHRNDVEKTSEIFSNVMLIKFLISCASFIILFILVSTVNEFYSNALIYYCTFGLVIGQFLMPFWFFQGIEKMKIVSILFFISKLISTILVFVLIKEKSDYFLIPIINSVASILVGILGVIIAFRLHVYFKMPLLKDLKYYLYNGWHLFLSNIAVTFYTVFVVTVLGFFYNTTVVGYYSISEKLISAFRSVIGPFSQVFYPYLSKLHITSKERVLQINKKILIYGGSVFLVLSLILFVFAKQILWLLYQTQSIEAVYVFRIMSFIPFIIFVHTVFALFTILVFGYNKEYSKIIISGGLTNIALSFILIPLYKHVGAAICVILIEIFVGIRYYLLMKKKNINLF